MSLTLNLSSLQMVGCDYEIDSNATEDRCGVCLGDGSACQTVKKMFKQKEGSGNKQFQWQGAEDEGQDGVLFFFFLADCNFLSRL